MIKFTVTLKYQNMLWYQTSNPIFPSSISLAMLEDILILLSIVWLSGLFVVTSFGSFKLSELPDSVIVEEARVV